MCQTPRSGRWRVLLWAKPVRTLALQGTAALPKTDGALVKMDLAVLEELSLCVCVCDKRLDNYVIKLWRRIRGNGAERRAGGF